MEITDAVEADLPKITEIYNDVIRTSTAIFSDAPVTVEDQGRLVEGAGCAGVSGARGKGRERDCGLCYVWGFPSVAGVSIYR